MLRCVRCGRCIGMEGRLYMSAYCAAFTSCSLFSRSSSHYFPHACTMLIEGGCIIGRSTFRELHATPSLVCIKAVSGTMPPAVKSNSTAPPAARPAEHASSSPSNPSVKPACKPGNLLRPAGGNLPVAAGGLFYKFSAT